MQNIKDQCTIVVYNNLGTPDFMKNYPWGHNVFPYSVVLFLLCDCTLQAEYGRENLLYHPVVSSLLHHKWNTFGFCGYLADFFFFGLFLTFLNINALIGINPLSEKCEFRSTMKLMSFDFVYNCIGNRTMDSNSMDECGRYFQSNETKNYFKKSY